MYIHSDVFVAQSSKKPDQPCGDAYGIYRDERATTMVLADGLGSGIKANIAANLCVSRLLALVRLGMSVREAFAAVSSTMDNAWGSGDPFSVFTIAHILNNGQTTVLSYEMPPPLQVTRTYAHILRDRVYTRGKAVIHESNCIIEKGEGLLLLSDGITQAGMGKQFVYGWGIEGVCSYIQSFFPMNPLNGETIVDSVHDKARLYWPLGKGDDCSALLALNRRGVIVNLMSGPPLMVADDEEWTRQFREAEGIHVVSGGSTAKIVARCCNLRLEVNESHSPITPPSFSLEGINLVTEGMVTLNQVYNLLEENPGEYPQNSPASDLAEFLKMADKVIIWLGLAENLNEERIEFRQQGLLNRQKIISKIVDRLREQGKLVVVQEK